jgi:hypothetical protein
LVGLRLQPGQALPKIGELLGRVREIHFSKSICYTETVTNLLHKDKPNLPNGFIRFENIAGRRADVFARECFQRKREEDRMVRFEGLEAILRK